MALKSIARTLGSGRQNRIDSLNESLKRYVAGHFNPLSIHPSILALAEILAKI
jgi:hypothetical protein